MENRIKELIDNYEEEVNRCHEALYYSPNGNERIEGLIHAYDRIIQDLTILIK